MNTAKGNNIVGTGIFMIGLIFMTTAVLMGNTIQPEVSKIGMDAYLAQHGTSGWLKFMLFAFGFPLGLAIGGTGLFAASGGKGARLLLFGLLLIVAALLPILAPLLLGKQPSAEFFGTSGYIMLLLIVFVLWLWGSYRAKSGAGERTVADLQGAGYLCFAMASWNLCGIGGMPSFALTPEKMLATGASSFATGQMKAVMLLLLAGWTLTLLGFYIAVRKGSCPVSHK
jgi:hypothetical protein